SFSAKLSAPRAETRVANSSVRAGNAAERRVNTIAVARAARVIAGAVALTHQVQQAWSPLSRNAGEDVERSEVGEGDTASPGPLSPCIWVKCSCRRPREKSSRRPCPYPLRGRGSRR